MKVPSRAHFKKPSKAFYLLAISLITAEVCKSQFVLSLGTGIPMQRTNTVELRLGSYVDTQQITSDTTSTISKLGAYLIFGAGQRTYEKPWAQFVPYSSENVLPEDHIRLGYQSINPLRYMGAGVILGLENQRIPENGSLLLMIGGEAGKEGPLQRIIENPNGQFGPEYYAVGSSHDVRYGVGKVQLFYENPKRILYGIGFAAGTHTSIIYHIGITLGK